MIKELIRNGGFERGNFDFWEFTPAVFTIDTVEKNRGTYAVECMTAGAGTNDIYSKDYIKVNPFELYQYVVWIKNTNMSTIDLQVQLLDSDLTEISKITLETIASPQGWTKHLEYVDIPEDCYYVRFWIHNTAVGIAQMWLDDVSMHILDISRIFVQDDEMIKVVNETTKHTVTGDDFFTGIWKEAEYWFALTSFTETGGANPVTLDVKIQTWDKALYTWRDAMVFQQKSCGASGSVTTQEYKRLTGNLGWKQRVSYTTAGAGTIGDCDFKVGVVYKR